MNKKDVIAHIRGVIDRDYGGSQSAFAANKKISTAYLNDVLRERRDPGKKILNVVGIERDSCYRLKG